MVDTLGHILSILITPADRPEREGAKEMLDQSRCHHGWLRKLWVDGGFSGEDFANHVKSLRKVMDVEVVKRSDTAKGFKVLPRRWVGGRSGGSCSAGVWSGTMSGLFRAQRVGFTWQ
jgi:transposase